MSSALRPTPNLEDQVSVFLSARDRVAQVYPRHGGYDLQGYGGRYSNPPSYCTYVYKTAESGTLTFGIMELSYLTGGMECAEWIIH
jgi:hypothetical protein